MRTLNIFWVLRIILVNTAFDKDDDEKMVS